MIIYDLEARLCVGWVLCILGLVCLALNKYPKIKLYLPKNPWIYYIIFPFLASVVVFFMKYLDVRLSRPAIGSLVIGIGMLGGILLNKAKGKS